MSHPPQTPPLRTRTSHDVIVVGARAAGAATAMLLARRGLRTLLVDRGVLGVDTLSTHALMRAGVLQLSRWGLLDAIVAAGTPAIRRTTFRYAHETIALDLKPSYGVDALYAPRRTILDPLLVRAAGDAGAEVRFGTTVTGVLRRGDRVTGVTATTDDGRSVELGARLVIGADGVRSTIARQVRPGLTRSGRHSAAATYGYWTDLDVDGYQWNFRRDRCSGIIPTNHGQACVFASAGPATIGRGGVELIEATVAEAAPELAERLRAATAPAGTRTWSGSRGYIRRAHGPGWALVGDAGYFKDPISAHGITDAFRDAELLSRAVADGWEDDAALEGALTQFESTRDSISIPLFDVVDRIAGNEWDDREIGALLMQQSAAMAAEVELLAALDAEPVR